MIDPDDLEITEEYFPNLESRIADAWVTFSPPDVPAGPKQSGFADEFARADQLWRPLRLFEYDVYSPPLRQSMPLIFLATPLAFYHWAAWGIETIRYIGTVAFGREHRPDFDPALDFDVALHGYGALAGRYEEFRHYALHRSFSTGAELLAESRSLCRRFALLFE